MLDEFIKICNMSGSDIEMSQGTGGNISVKFDNKMYIKSSGVRLDDISDVYGYTAIRYSEVSEYIFAQNSLDNAKKDREAGLNSVLTSSKCDSSQKRPSMESGFHSLFGRCVLHLHPIYLNIFLCMNEGEKLLKKIFSDIEYSYIPYYSPGYNLSYFLSLQGY